MTAAVLRLTALGIIVSFSEQMTGDGPMKGGIRLIAGLMAAEMILELALALPSAVFG